MSKSYAVIGGEGFLGHAMVVILTERYPGSKVVSLDLVQRHQPEKQKWTFTPCDLTNEHSLVAAFKDNKINTVFHTASPHLSSGKDVCEKVNVQGTQTVVAACKAAQVKTLIYTSSAGVCFDGTDLIAVDERCTPPEKPFDAYNDTKARAEEIVLAANGENGLLTCAIRPAGIFGPGDRQNIPGLLRALKSGKTKFTIGNNENLTDLTYVDNVVHAHLLAAEKIDYTAPVSVFDTRIRPTAATIKRRVLPTSFTSPIKQGASDLSEKEVDPPLPATRNRFDQWFDAACLSPEEKAEAGVPVAGEAFYVSNGEAIPFWSYGRAVWYAYNGHSSKMAKLPLEVGLMYATIENFYCWLVGKQTDLPRKALYFAAAKRYVNIEKARRVLGYEPIIGVEEGIKRSVEWYKENEASLAAPPAKA